MAHVTPQQAAAPLQAEMKDFEYVQYWPYELSYEQVTSFKGQPNPQLVNAAISEATKKSDKNAHYIDEQFREATVQKQHAMISHIVTTEFGDITKALSAGKTFQQAQKQARYTMLVQLAYLCGE